MHQTPPAQIPARPIPSLFTDPLARLLLGVLGFLALLSNRPAFAAFCLVLLLLSTGAKLWRRRVCSRVISRFRLDKLRVHPEEPLAFAVEVTNGSLLPMTVRSTLAGIGGLSGGGSEADVRAGRVEGHGTTRLAWEFEAPGRGVYPMGPPRTEAGDGLGLFFQETARGRPLELVVYPRRFPLFSLAWPSRELFGRIRAEGLIEDPVNLMGTREYQPGRPARAIHWKASVRLNRLQEKVFEPSRRARILLSLDVTGFRESGDEAAFEASLEAAASVAVHLIRNGVSVGLITNAVLVGGRAPVLPVSQEPDQAARVLECMARMRMEPARDLVPVARSVLTGASGMGCFHFVYRADATVRAFGALASGCRIPVTFLAVRRGESPGVGAGIAGDVVLIQTLRSGEGGTL